MTHHVSKRNPPSCFVLHRYAFPLAVLLNSSNAWFYFNRPCRAVWAPTLPSCWRCLVTERSGRRNSKLTEIQQDHLDHLLWRDWRMGWSVRSYVVISCVCPEMDDPSVIPFTAYVEFSGHVFPCWISYRPENTPGEWVPVGFFQLRILIYNSLRIFRVPSQESQSQRDLASAYRLLLSRLGPEEALFSLNLPTIFHKICSWSSGQLRGYVSCPRWIEDRLLILSTRALPSSTPISMTGEESICLIWRTCLILRTCVIFSYFHPLLVDVIVF